MQRTEATVRAPDGSSFKVTKGAAHAVLGLIQTNTEVIASSVNNKVQHFPPLHWCHSLPAVNVSSGTRPC